MNWIDLLISATVLVAVAAAAERGSSTLAAVAATLPTGVPLALYLFSRKPGSNVEQFLIEAMKGIAATFFFALGAWAVARQSKGQASLGVLCVSGYCAWGIAWLLLRLV